MNYYEQAVISNLWLVQHRRNMAYHPFTANEIATTQVVWWLI
jgi:hypothetical protein